MFRFVAITLLAIGCHCQVLINNDKFVTSGLKTVGVSGLSSLPIASSYYSSSVPVGYGVSGLGLNYGLGLDQGLGLNYGLGLNQGLGLNYLSTIGGLRSAVLGGQIISPYQKSLLALQQPAVGYAVSQPALGLAVSRPALAVAQPALSIAKSAVIAPQLLSSEAVRPVTAAIQQVGRTVEYRTVPTVEGPIVPQEVVVEPSDQPLNIHFRSRSSTVRLTQEHIGGEPGTIEQTSSQDEPSKVVHEVVKPVVQEVREVIQPYRQVTQEIQPVVEKVHTVVAEGQGRSLYAAEPIVKQLSVGVAQPTIAAIARPTLAIAQPTLAVQQPALTVARPGLAIAQPSLAIAQENLAIAQPSLAIAQPGLAIAQPTLSVAGFPRYQTLAVGQRVETLPGLSASIVRTPAFYGAQPVLGYNRVLSVQRPVIGVRREEVRQVRPEINSERDNSQFSEE